MGSENRRRRQKWISGYSTKAEAAAELNRMLHELRTGQYVEPADMSTGAWLDLWLDKWCKGLSPYTLRGYGTS
jgi:hypothetical protein